MLHTEVVAVFHRDAESISDRIYQWQSIYIPATRLEHREIIEPTLSGGVETLLSEIPTAHSSDGFKVMLCGHTFTALWTQTGRNPI